MDTNQFLQLFSASAGVNYPKPMIVLSPRPNIRINTKIKSIIFIKFRCLVRILRQNQYKIVS